MFSLGSIDAFLQLSSGVASWSPNMIQIYGKEKNDMIAIMATFALVSFAIICWSSRSKQEVQCRQYPPYLLNPSIESNTYLTFFETVGAMTGRETPLFLYRCMKRIPLTSQLWVARLNMGMTRHSKMRFSVADAHVAKQILMDPDSVKSPGYEYEFSMLTNGKKSLVSTNGIRWKHARKNIAYAFSQRHVRRMDKVCEEKLAHWMKYTLEPLEETGGSFDLCSEMVSLTLSIICESAFEYQITAEEKASFLKNLDIAQKEFIFMNPFHRHFPFLFPQVWRAKAAVRSLMLFSLKIMDHYRAKNGNRIGDSKQNTIISSIINNPKYESDEDRAADISIMIIAGHDTTAYTIAWTLLEIARHQPSEILDYRKQIKNLRREEWKGVNELQYIIKESMRMNPVISISGRMIGKDFIVNNPDSGTSTIIPKNHIAFINFYSIFRNPAYYRTPDKFLPSRWEKPSLPQQRDEKNIMKVMKLAHIPFAVGSRDCIGQRLATAEINTVLSTLCALYDFEIADEGAVDYFMTLKPLGVKFIPHKLSKK